MVRYASAEIPFRSRAAFRLRRGLTAVLAALFFLMVIYAAPEAAARARLADTVLRFHVLANSDSEADQNLKLQVRDAVLALLREVLGDSPGELAETETIVEGCMDRLCAAAETAVRRAGADYPVHAELAVLYFPEKVCGDKVFPAGRYRALRIVIGEGEGHNWWGLLFPSDCFLEAVRGIAPEEGEEIEGLLEDTAVSWKDVIFKIRTRWF